MTLEQALTIAIVTLAAAVSTLWVKVGNCEKDRLELWKVIASLKERVGICERCDQQPKRVKSQKP